MIKKYEKMTDSDKKQLLIRDYEINKKSFADIAKEYGTYANKIRRDAIKYKLQIRNKSEAQKNALDSGRINHPTKGKKRTDEIKNKIGLSVLQSWESLDQNELEQRKLKAKNNWENLSDNDRQNMLKTANAAVRESSKKGSKLERFLLHKLLESGHSVEFHKEHSILNTKLQIDLFLPKLDIAIEVDGPSHFEPVWGDDALKRNKKYDNKKTGLIIGKGLFLIRIQQSKDFSNARGLIIYDKLVEAIKSISTNSLSNNKVIKIGDI